MILGFVYDGKCVRMTTRKKEGKHMRKLITRGAEAEEMKQYAMKNQNMQTLKMAAISLVEKGITTFEELERVAYYDD